ncbi:MAG: hypothetical protein DMF85_00375 [Acidobacteria bacterium]|nr:MAG: hypothetical protein DMF85_00375 [Acidobacteriota bacterium]
MANPWTAEASRKTYSANVSQTGAARRPPKNRPGTIAVTASRRRRTKTSRTAKYPIASTRPSKAGSGCPPVARPYVAAPSAMLFHRHAGCASVRSMP